MMRVVKGEPSYPIPWRRRLTVRLIGGLILVLFTIGIPFLFAFHLLLRQQQYDTLAQTTFSLSSLMIDGLRSSMTAGEPHLFDETIRGIAGQSDVERVVLLDHTGRVKISSDPAFEGRTLDRDRDETCQVCHRTEERPGKNWRIVDAGSGTRVFRTVMVIANEPSCHSCHDPSVSSNGLLLMDLNLRGFDRRFLTGIGSTITLGAVMVLLTVAVLVRLLRRTVLSPLREIVSASQRIVEGDLDSRAVVSGPGEFSHLAWQVNRMTDHLAQSIRVVENQKTELQAILDAIDDEIIVLDKDRRIVAANKAFRSKLDREPAEVTGHVCGEPDSATTPCGAGLSGGCPVQKVFATGRLEKGMLSHGTTDGKERIIEIHASPLSEERGEVTQVVEVRRDISERRQMEAILAHSEHLASLGLLASGLSHEINNPLGAIATLVEGLRRRLPGDGRISREAATELDEILRRIGNEVERGRTITHRLLRIARPAQQRRGLVDVNQVIEEVIAVLAHDIEGSAIRVTIDKGPNLPLFRGDETQIVQIVMNACLNAIQAMAGNGGELRITTAQERDRIGIVVSDTGAGIPGEVMKRIYEPFFTTKPAGKGTGLGLFIMHQILTDLGGTIDVQSQHREGTTVSMWLPVDPESVIRS